MLHVSFLPRDKKNCPIPKEKNALIYENYNCATVKYSESGTIQHGGCCRLPASISDMRCSIQSIYRSVILMRKMLSKWFSIHPARKWDWNWHWNGNRWGKSTGCARSECGSSAFPKNVPHLSIAFTYSLRKGQLTVSFYFGEWNVHGFPQHNWFVNMYIVLQYWAKYFIWNFVW